MFIEYITKPQVRMVCEIKECGRIEQDASHLYAYHHNAGSIYFSAYQEPKVGDFIVKNNDKDIYHVPRETFEASYDKHNSGRN